MSNLILKQDRSNVTEWAENEKKVTEIVNVLRHLTNYYQGNIKDNMIRVYASSLADYELEDIKTACRQIANNAEARFPTLKDIKSILFSMSGGSQNDKADDLKFNKKKSEEDKLFLDRINWLKSVLGDKYESTKEKYMQKWLSEFFNNDVNFEYAQFINSDNFFRLAITDLVEANGNPTKAIEIMQRKNRDIESSRKAKVREVLRKGE